MHAQSSLGSREAAVKDRARSIRDAVIIGVVSRMTAPVELKKFAPWLMATSSEPSDKLRHAQRKIQSTGKRSDPKVVRIYARSLNREWTAKTVVRRSNAPSIANGESDNTSARYK